MHQCDIFLPYAKHKQEVEDVITTIGEAILNGESQLFFELDDDFSEEDCKYIEQEVMRRYGQVL
jgi:hypothetical protein